MPGRGRGTSTTEGVLQRFTSMDSNEFAAHLNSLRAAEDAITESIVEQVQQENITPLQGLGILGCATAQLYGYQAFHGQPSFADVWSATNPQG